MITPHCRKSYSASLVGLIVRTISHLILNRPSLFSSLALAAACLHPIDKPSEEGPSASHG